MSIKLEIIQPTQFARVAPNTSCDIIFKLNYFCLGSTSADITVKLSDTVDFDSPTTFTPTSMETRVVGTTAWAGSIGGNTIDDVNVGMEVKYSLDYPNENKVKYLKLICTEGANVYESNPILISSVYDLDFTLKSPIEVSYLPTRIKVSDKKIVTEPSSVTIRVEATNNAFDVTPTWENITDSYINNGFYTFVNTTKTSVDWGINIRITISKTTSSATVELNELYIGFA